MRGIGDRRPRAYGKRPLKHLCHPAPPIHAGLWCLLTVKRRCPSSLKKSSTNPYIYIHADLYDSGKSAAANHARRAASHPRKFHYSLSRTGCGELGASTDAQQSQQNHKPPSIVLSSSTLSSGSPRHFTTSHWGRADTEKDVARAAPISPLNPLAGVQP